MVSPLRQFLDHPGLWFWAAPARAWRLRAGRTKAPPLLASARRILVIRPDELGDLVLSLPFLHALRRSAPGARITLVVKSGHAELLHDLPAVDHIAELPFSPHAFVGKNRLLGTATLRLRRKPEFSAGFDCVLLPRRDPDWCHAALAAHLLAGAGAVVRHREQVVLNSVTPVSPADSWADAEFSNPAPEHEVHHNLRFLRWLGAGAISADTPSLPLADSDRAAASDWLAVRGLEPRRFFVLHPSGGRSPLKQWPIARFQTVLAGLSAQTGLTGLVVGGPDETWIANFFSPGAHTRLALGSLSLRQLAAVMSQASLFVGGDSGPMHLATATGIPAVGIFGPTSVLRFRPFAPRARAVSVHCACSPDDRRTFENRCQTCPYPAPRCLAELPVGTVISACLEALARR